ncbi:uncharacterized protein PgNI_07240 [Pyricularia grisea]|uniref:FAD-binding PCMH-type domain-containing protein n=1 Tax=Pyricularia grisea TaxID=148305 RepID=A0A6P8B059_PYRGI|nr:uncharacterized protein PgNI_07240 [Pyricularia grisea]TLD08232.1 hypothetical protein PgNI_07240 [Pyricularia grisea]
MFSLPKAVVAALMLLHGARADVCSTLPSSSPKIEIVRPLTAKWTGEQLEYWSTGCGKLHPSCILYPKNAQEVAAIVEALRETNETFAIKSGGHNPNLYFASIDGGPLISTGSLNQVELDTATETAKLSPGNRWDEVADKLDGSGYSIVGGRLGNVGVGGYMLGGGLSFMSTEYGWAANSVESYELVLANATIINVTRDSHPSLFKSLKGGGNVYGIVTSFTVKVYKQGTVWGGNYFFNATPATDAALLEAVADFAMHYPDPKAGIILTAERTGLGTVDFWTMFLYYNGEQPPAGVFDRFKSIKPWLDTTKTRTYTDLVNFNNWAVLKGSVYTIGTETIPMPSLDATNSSTIAASTLQDVHKNWRDVGTPALLKVGGLIASTAYQPVPRSMAAVARSKGGDLLDLNDDTDLIVMEYNYSWLLEGLERQIVDQALQDTYNGVRERVVAGQAAGELPADAYLPLFANDAYFRQDYFGRLRPESREMAAAAKEAVDPERFFATKTEGFKM